MHLYDKAVINDKEFQIVRVGMSGEGYILASIYIKDVIDVLRSAGVIQSDVVQEQPDISKRVRDIVRARTRELEDGFARMLKDWDNQG